MCMNLITGRGRVYILSKLKISNNNVTRTSNKNVTEEIDPNFFIYKGEEVIRHLQLRSNKNVTIL